MKLRLISVLIFTAIITACSCGITDNDFEVPYPSSFDPVVVNENTICDWGGSNSIVLFDTVLKKVLYLYDFTPVGSEAMAKGMCGDNLFVQLDKSKHEKVKGIVIKIKISTGEVSKIDFYDDSPYSIAVVDKQVWIDSCTSYSPVDHKILVYDTLTDNSEIIQCPDPINSLHGAKIGSDWYIPIGGRSGENSRLFNIKTQQMINFTNLIDVKFKSSSAFFFKSNISGNIYFQIFGYEEGTTSGDYTDCLYRIDSLNPISGKRILKQTLGKPLRVMDVIEYNNSLYVSLTKTGDGIPQQTFQLQKYSLIDYSLQAEKEISDGGNAITVGNGSIWMLRFKRDAACQMYEINPDTLEYTLR